MNAIQTASSHSVRSDISALRENLNMRIDNGNRCEEFFNLYSLPKRNQSEDFPMAHYNYMGSFSTMFSCISDNKLQQWKETCQTIFERMSSISSITSIAEKGSICDELYELKIKIKLIEKTNEVFCKKIICLIQNNAKIMLQGEHIFFLAPLQTLQGGMGECHCCESMGREKRNEFSHDLIERITTVFPEKKSISIASIGAGTCFHELEIQSLALQKGYEISEWILVGPMLQSETTKNFTTIVKWATPNITVTSVSRMAHEYFTGLQNSSSVPDVFLFIDVDLHIQESQVQDYAQKLNHLGLFAYFAKNQRYGAEYYESELSS